MEEIVNQMAKKDSNILGPYHCCINYFKVYIKAVHSVVPCKTSIFVTKTPCRSDLMVDFLTKQIPYL